jgi:hypothetical protein
MRAERTLTMTVENTGFMVDRLGQDCSPMQFLRELTQNSIEAVQATEERSGEIIWDVDWDHYALTGVFKLCVTDNGVGMTGEEMVHYINKLSSSVHEQTFAGNFGVGAKIAAATRNHDGLVYLSWKGGLGSMIHLWRDPDLGEYGLRQFERPDGTFGHFGHIEDALKPDTIGNHGTKVVLLGNELSEDTMQAPEGAPTPSQWIARYLNTRYFRFPDGVVVKAREGWEHPRSDSDRNVLRTVVGQEQYLEQHKQSSGTVRLTGASAHWWVLKDEPALTQHSGRIASSGHIAALYQDELYEMNVGRAGTARLQLFGIIYGYQRVVLYNWAAEFRAKMPEEIVDLMEEVTRGSNRSDHRQAIRDRLKQISDLLRLSRYRPSTRGDKLADPTMTSGGRAMADETSRRNGGSSAGGHGGRAGNVYALFLTTEEGRPATEFHPEFEPQVEWVTVDEGTREPGFLEDRAAKYHIEQNLLQINGDFRVFTDMVKRWCDRYSHVPSAERDITDACREWFEQALIETVLGVQTLKDSREWSIEDIKHALSEEALSSAVMQRYHIEVAVRRALGAKLGSIKDRAH